MVFLLKGPTLRFSDETGDGTKQEERTLTEAIWRNRGGLSLAGAKVKKRGVQKSALPLKTGKRETKQRGEVVKKEGDISRERGCGGREKKLLKRSSRETTNESQANRRSVSQGGERKENWGKKGKKD